MAKGQPFSVRLERQTEQLIEAEARRTRRSKSAVVGAFAEETALHSALARNRLPRGGCAADAPG